MAEGKKSFQLYTDLIDFINGSNVHNVEVEGMTDEEVGKLFRWILEYVNDLHPPIPREIKYVVAIVKRQLDEDLESWKKQCEVNRKNGALGGRPKKPKETQENRTGFQETENNPQKPDKDKDKDKDNNGIINNSLSSKLADACLEIINYLNLKTNKNFKPNAKATQDFIKARLKDGYSIDDFKKVIDNKCYQWLGTEQEQYLRPETLFRPSHFESYLNEVVKSGVKNNPFDLPDAGFRSL